MSNKNHPYILSLDKGTKINIKKLIRKVFNYMDIGTNSSNTPYTRYIISTYYMI